MATDNRAFNGRPKGVMNKSMLNKTKAFREAITVEMMEQLVKNLFEMALYAEKPSDRLQATKLILDKSIRSVERDLEIQEEAIQIKSKEQEAELRAKLLTALTNKEEK